MVFLATNMNRVSANLTLFTWNNFAIKKLVLTVPDSSPTVFWLLLLLLLLFSAQSGVGGWENVMWPPPQRNEVYRSIIRLQFMRNTGPPRKKLRSWTFFQNLSFFLQFELGRQARPGRHTGIRLYWLVPAEGQNKSWGHRLTAKASTY
jgi:hypothetical protein